MTIQPAPDYRALLVRVLTLGGAGSPETLADGLFAAFGSFSAVFDADPVRLFSVKGMTRSAAALIKLLPALAGRARQAACPLLHSIFDPRLGDCLAARFYNVGHEVLVLLCAAADGKILDVSEYDGGAGSVTVSVKQLTERAVAQKAAVIALAHNHPEGFAIPSAADNNASLALYRFCQKIGVRFYDHLIISDGDWVSMRQSGEYE